MTLCLCVSPFSYLLLCGLEHRGTETRGHREEIIPCWLRCRGLVFSPATMCYIIRWDKFKCRKNKICVHLLNQRCPRFYHLHLPVGKVMFWKLIIVNDYIQHKKNFHHFFACGNERWKFKFLTNFLRAGFSGLVFLLFWGGLVWVKNDFILVSVLWSFAIIAFYGIGFRIMNSVGFLKDLVLVFAIIAFDGISRTLVLVLRIGSFGFELDILDLYLVKKNRSWLILDLSFSPCGFVGYWKT